MSDSDSYKSSLPQTPPQEEVKTVSPFAKVIKAILWSLCALVALVVIGAVGATIYLSPSRTAALVNKEASKYLKADVKVSDVNWRLWSSFPWLKVEIDSVSVKSRSLDGLSPAEKRLLPPHAAHLASTGRIKGALNIWKALKGDILLQGIEIDRPDINLVQFNDTVANFLIFPPMKKEMEVPDISLDTIRIGRPLSLSFLSIDRDAEVKAVVEKLELHGKENLKGLFGFIMETSVEVRAGEFSSGAPLPVNIAGELGIEKGGKKVDVKTLDIALDNIRAHIAGVINMSSVPSAFPLSVSVETPDLMHLLPYVPAALLPAQIKDLKAFLPINAKAELLAPFPFDGSAKIPALTAAVSSDGGSLTYPLSPSQNIHLEGLGLEADAIVDPSDPERSRLSLADLRMETDGTSMHISGGATRLLMANPDIHLDLQCAADLDKAVKKLLPSSGMTVSGDLSGTSSLSCQLSDLSKKQLKNLKLDGNFQVAALALNDAASRLSARLSDFSMKLAADLPEVSSSSLSDGKLDLMTYVGHAEIKAPSSGMDAVLDKASLNGDFGAKGSMSAPVASGVLKFHSSGASFLSGASGLTTEGASADIQASLRQIPFSPSNYFSTTPTSLADSAVAAKFHHTPLYLVADVPPMLQSVLSLIDMKASVAVDKGAVRTPAFPAQNTFSDLRLQTNLDTLRISSLRLKTRGAAGFISGKVEGLRSFLSSSSPVPLKASLMAELEDVDINRLSGTYFRGVENLTGKPAQLLPPPLGPYSAADSLCIALPRNLSLDASLSSRSAEYMQFAFAPLSTRILMDNGTATLKNLSIGTTFCRNNIDWTFSTSDLDSVGMALKVDVDDFDFDKFCKAFPDLAASSPQLKNLSADVSLHASGNFLMNPNMFVEAPSMEGDVTLNVRDLSFKREGKALKYTHLMLIRGDGPISIDSLDIHAAFHDNLLQLDPFTIDGGGYKLLVGGVNNLRGQMYYHVGLLHNPLHLPFGVNLVGYFRHPEFRFGGRWIKDGRERKIAADLGSDVKVNIMRNLSHGWLLFVGNAAKYDFKNNSTQDLNVR